MQKEKEQNNKYSSDWIPYIEEVKRYKEFADNFKNKTVDPYISEIKRYKKYAWNVYRFNRNN